MVQLQLHLFGPPRVLRASQTVELGLRKALALFLYLAAVYGPKEGLWSH